jgi:hypothetical protein
MYESKIMRGLSTTEYLSIVRQILGPERRAANYGPQND